MKLCLDEMYSTQIAVALRGDGHDVCAVKERPELLGVGDAELWRRAGSERRTLVTENAQDFMPIVQQTVAAGEVHHGIVFSSPKSMPGSTATIGIFVTSLGRLLEHYPGDDDFVGQTVWLQP